MIAYDEMSAEPKLLRLSHLSPSSLVVAQVRPRTCVDHTHRCAFPLGTTHLVLSAPHASSIHVFIFSVRVVRPMGFYLHTIRVPGNRSIRHRTVPGHTLETRPAARSRRTQRSLSLLGRWRDTPSKGCRSSQEKFRATSVSFLRRASAYAVLHLNVSPSLALASPPRDRPRVERRQRLHFRLLRSAAGYLYVSLFALFVVAVYVDHDPIHEAPERQVFRFPRSRRVLHRAHVSLVRTNSATFEYGLRIVGQDVSSRIFEESNDVLSVQTNRSHGVLIRDRRSRQRNELISSSIPTHRPSNRVKMFRNLLERSTL